MGIVVARKAGGSVNIGGVRGWNKGGIV